MKRSGEIARIESWTRRQIIGRRDEGNCIRIELRHLGVGKARGQDVNQWHIPRKVSEDYVEQIVKAIDECAQDDANGMGAMQRYVLFAFFEEDTDAKARLIFRKHGNEDEVEGEALDSEPPTKAGMTAQLMRHTEVIMKTSYMMTGQNLMALQRENQELREENRQLREERRQYIESYEGMLTEKHVRDLETKQAEFMIDAKKQMFDKLSLIAPAIVNRMVGKPILPEKVTPEGMAIKALVDSITPAQMAQLQSVFQPDQVISLLNLYEANRTKDANGVPQLGPKKE